MKINENQIPAPPGDVDFVPNIFSARRYENAVLPSVFGLLAPPSGQEVAQVRPERRVFVVFADKKQLPPPCGGAAVGRGGEGRGLAEGVQIHWFRLLRERQGASGSARELRGALGSPGELQGAPGSSGGPRGASGSHRGAPGENL